MGFQRLSIILFRIIAIPLSILWFIITIYELFSVPSWDQISMQRIALNIFLQGLLFSAALSNHPPWKNKSLIKFVFVFGLIIFYLVLYIGSFLIVGDALEPIIGHWLSGVSAFLVFIALSAVVAIIIGIFEHKLNKLWD